MKFGIAVVVAATLGACAAGLSEEDRKFRDEYIVDEQACVAKRKAGVYTSAQAYDCVCKVMARRGKVCDLPGKDGGQ